MPTCPQCYTGTCKRHERQDHGRSLVKCVNENSTLKKIYDQFVGSQLQKIQAEAVKDPSKKHTESYRKQLDASRDKTLRKSAKSRSKRVKADIPSNGLNPQALAAIGGSSDSEEETRRERKKKKHKHKHSKKSKNNSDDSPRKKKQRRE